MAAGIDQEVEIITMLQTLTQVLDVDNEEQLEHDWFARRECFSLYEYHDFHEVIAIATSSSSTRVIEHSTEDGAVHSQTSNATDLVTVGSIRQHLADHQEELNDSSFAEELEDERDVNEEVNKDRFQM